MSQYILRLDDASEYMDVQKWQQIEDLLDKFDIKPLVGIIPENRDQSMVEIYKRNLLFWNKVSCWQEKGWELALHGCFHKYTTSEGGVNPVNRRSEFAGVSLTRQKELIRYGIGVLRSHQIEPRVFFPPSHTFDTNTLIALKEESGIRIISDTIANDIYFSDDFFFVPQQSGQARKLPFKIVTFCYHPNLMGRKEFEKLDNFLYQYQRKFISFSELEMRKKKRTVFDEFLCKLYFAGR